MTWIKQLMPATPSADIATKYLGSIPAPDVPQQMMSTLKDLAILYLEEDWSGMANNVVVDQWIDMRRHELRLDYPTAHIRARGKERYMKEKAKKLKTSLRSTAAAKS